MSPESVPSPAPALRRSAIRRTASVLLLAALMCFIGVALSQRPTVRRLPPEQGAATPLGESDFRTDGAFTSTDPASLPPGIATRGSWIDSDAFQGTHETGWYRAIRHFRIFLAGYPALAGNRVEIEVRTHDGAVRTLRYAAENPGEAWQAWNITLDDSDRAFRIRAIDASSELRGWLAFSEPSQPPLPFAPVLATLGAIAFGAAFVLALIASHRSSSEQPSGWRWLARPPLWFTLLACAAILVARRPEAWRVPQFWAEDGTIFYWSAHIEGAKSILQPYAGYFHLLPRLVALAAAQADPQWAPALFSLGAALLTLYVAARTQSERFPFPPHLGFALVVVLVPDLFEVLFLLVNVQWILAAGLCLLLVSREARHTAQWIHDFVAAVLLGLTGPFGILLAPFFVWRAWQRRTRGSTLLAAVILTTAAIQAWMILHFPIGPGQTPVDPATVLAVPGMRVTGSLLIGAWVPRDFPRLSENILGLLALAAVVALAARRGPSRVERTCLAGAFVLVLASALYRCRFILPGVCHAGVGTRYFYLPQLLVLWLLLATAREASRRLSMITGYLLIWSLMVNLPRLRERALTDMHWRDYAPKIRAGEAVQVPINPDWFIDLPAKKP